MTVKNSKAFQSVIQQPRMRAMLCLLLTLGLLAGCANALDTTNEELNSSSDGMTHLAMRLHEQGDDAGAIEFYRRALQRKPDDVKAIKGIAAILESGNYNAQAAEYYQQLVKMQPDNAENLRDYGRVLIKSGRPVDARQQYETALALDPNDVKSLNGLGVALDLIGNRAAAQEQYKKALAQKSDDLMTITNFGHSYVLSERYEEAIRLLEPHAENKQAPPALRQNLAQAYSARGMNVDAERVLKKDMTVDEARRFLNTHNARRDPTSGNCLPERPGTADLGSFGTPSLADAHASRMRAQFPVETQGLVFEVVPEVKAEGGTPDFHVRAHGFKNVGAAKAFCDEIKKKGPFCKAQ